MIGNIYILSNEAFRDNYYKIGFTRSTPKNRAKQLYNTSTVFPFQIEYCKRVKSPQEVEKMIHKALLQYRINLKREFFNIELCKAIEICEILNKDFEYKDETYNTDYYKEQLEYINELKKRRDFLIKNGNEDHSFLDKIIKIEENLLNESYCYYREEYYKYKQGEYPDEDIEKEEYKSKIKDNNYFLES
jgi:hypothetical protein